MLKPKIQLVTVGFESEKRQSSSSPGRPCLRPHSDLSPKQGESTFEVRTFFYTCYAIHNCQLRSACEAPTFRSVLSPL